MPQLTALVARTQTPASASKEPLTIGHCRALEAILAWLAGIRARWIPGTAVFVFLQER